MIENNSILKNMKIFGIIFALVVAFGFVIQVPCVAEETTLTPYYEKITKQYPSMEQYVANSRKKIKENWYPSSASFEHSAVMVLRINKDGKLLDSYISSSSENKSFDDSLIEAARKTTFSPLPEDVNEDSVDIDMSFKMQRRKIFLNR